jgi:hypothetical protein
MIGSMIDGTPPPSELGVLIPGKDIGSEMVD